MNEVKDRATEALEHCCAFHLFVLSASCRPPPVFVMQSTDARHLHHSALTRQLHSPRLGCVFLTAINVSASRCSNRRTSTESLEDAVRRSRRGGPGTHVESSRSPA